MKKEYSKNKLIALCSIVYFASYLCRKNFAVAMAGMLAEEVFDKGTAGLIGTALFAAYGFGQLLSGYLGDKWQPNHMILFGLSLSALCNALMPLVPQPFLMIPVWAVNGLAQAMLWPPIVRLLSENLSHEDYVLGNAMVTCAAHSATLILYLFVPLCLRLWSWEIVFFATMAFALVVFLFFIFGMRQVLSDHPHSLISLLKTDGQTAQKGAGGYLRLLASAGVLPLLLSVALQGYLRDGIDSWLPTLFSEVFAVEATSSILLTVILPIFAVFSMFLSLILHKRILRNETLGTGVLFAFAAVFALLLALLIEVKHPLASVLCLILAALITTCAHCCNFFLISCLPGHFSRFGRAATTSGFCNAFTYLGSALASYGIALLTEHFGWRVNILSWVGISLLGVLCSALAYRRYTRFLQAVNHSDTEKQEEKETASAVA